MAAPTKDSSRTVFRSSVAFLTGTFLSRVSGLGRDMAMAFAFGSGGAIAAFMVAFRFANLIRRLFGEGPLTAGFIPRFEQIRGGGAEKEGAFFFRDLLGSVAVFLSGFILILEGILFGVLHWGSIHPDTAHILTLSMLMLPGVLFVCLFGVCSALLQCERQFFLTGFAPVAFNVVWIVTAVWLRGEEQIYASLLLSLAVIGAFFAQWVVLMPQTLSFLRRSLSWKECFRVRLFSQELRALVKPLFLGIIGVAAVRSTAH